MSVILLIIVFDGRHELTVHDAHEQAGRVLMDFIDQRWSSRFGTVPSPIDRSERAKMFFGANDEDLFVIVEADTSELERALANLPESILRGNKDGGEASNEERL